jgi:predicted small integral membrane protein
MAIRTLKVLFVASISLLCLIYAAQNVANLEACYATFAYVASGADHQAYAGSILPTFDSPVLIWSMLIIVVGLEFAAGAISAKGAWDMWLARQAPGAEFNAAKSYALIGCGTSIFIWLGLFEVLGGALFQMWQTQIGSGSMDDAFQFFVLSALVFAIVNGSDE